MIDRLRANMDQNDQKYSFLYRYISRDSETTYKFMGFNCRGEPCYQFDTNGVVSNFYCDYRSWILAKPGKNEIRFLGKTKFYRPTIFLAPEFCQIIKDFNDHILQEIKYLDWKIFIHQKRKIQEFKLICMCIGRIKIKVPSEILFHILSFLKGYDFCFG
jgi:hypothetical protein